MMKKITIVGMGYVGLSNLLLFAPHYPVLGFDINSEKLDMLKQGISPLKDKEIETYLSKYYKGIRFTNNVEEAFHDAEIIIIATSTDYDEQKKYFDTSSVTKVIEKISDIHSKAVVVIKSTIPFKFTKYIQKKHPNLTIIFSPEFLREGRALYDNLHPTRIVVGDKSEVGHEIANLFKSAALDKNVPIFCTDTMEAEAIKLFANNYLAMRVAFFNELDSFAISNDIVAKQIIEGISADPRIGNGYNNPSFGYGGYCLPKDTKQLLANFNNVPQNIIQATVDSNETRKNFIFHCIMKSQPKVIGIYRLIMKNGSDNFRSSSIQDIIYKLNAINVKVIIFEPTIQSTRYEDFDVINNLDIFAKNVDIIIANRIDEKISKYNNKIFTRDIFSEN